jgi:hypothetical protein
MIVIPAETGRCYVMEINVERKEGNENLKATIPITDYDKPNTTGEYGIFHVFE